MNERRKLQLDLWNAKKRSRSVGRLDHQWILFFSFHVCIISNKNGTRHQWQQPRRLQLSLLCIQNSWPECRADVLSTQSIDFDRMKCVANIYQFIRRMRTHPQPYTKGENPKENGQTEEVEWTKRVTSRPSIVQMIQRKSESDAPFADCQHSHIAPSPTTSIQIARSAFTGRLICWSPSFQWLRIKLCFIFHYFIVCLWLCHRPQHNMPLPIDIFEWIGCAAWHSENYIQQHSPPPKSFRIEWIELKKNNHY